VDRKGYIPSLGGLEMAKKLKIGKVEVKHEEVVQIPIENIDIDFEEKPHPEFVKSIKKFGVLTPIEVIKEGDKYKVLDGRRRLLACRYLGLQTIPAIVVKAETNDGEVLQIIGNVINLQRHENKNMLADSIFKLVEKGYTLYQIANLLGIKYGTVKEYLLFYKLPKEIKEAIVEGKVKPRVAKKLLELNENELKKAIEILQEKGKLTKNELKEIRSVDKREAKQILKQNNIKSLLNAEEDVDDINEKQILLNKLHEVLIELQLDKDAIKKIFEVVEKSSMKKEECHEEEKC